jgi:hypothetical protein
LPVLFEDIHPGSRSFFRSRRNLSSKPSRRFPAGGNLRGVRRGAFDKNTSRYRGGAGAMGAARAVRIEMPV